MQARFRNNRHGDPPAGFTPAACGDTDPRTLWPTISFSWGVELPTMHIPEGFLDARTAVTSGVLAIAGLGVALARVRRCATPRSIPLIGLAAAFVFAAQLLNFPVGGGTSGHLVGAVLIAVLLGPSDLPPNLGTFPKRVPQGLYHG